MKNLSSNLRTFFLLNSVNDSPIYCWIKHWVDIINNTFVEDQRLDKFNPKKPRGISDVEYSEEIKLNDLGEYVKVPVTEARVTGKQAQEVREVIREKLLTEADDSFGNIASDKEPSPILNAAMSKSYLIGAQVMQSSNEKANLKGRFDQAVTDAHDSVHSKRIKAKIDLSKWVDEKDSPVRLSWAAKGYSAIWLTLPNHLFNAIVDQLEYQDTPTPFSDALKGDDIEALMEYITNTPSINDWVGIVNGLLIHKTRLDLMGPDFEVNIGSNAVELRFAEDALARHEKEHDIAFQDSAEERNRRDRYIATPTSDLVDLLKAATKQPVVDERHYFVSNYYPLGLTALGRKTNFPVLIVDLLSSMEMEDLLLTRSRKESYSLMGTRADIMQRFPRLKDKDFDNAITINEVREQRLKEHVKTLVSGATEQVHLFRHWFSKQVADGVIKELDGHVFEDLYDKEGNLVKKADTTAEEFLYCHFDSLKNVRLLNIYPEYYTVHSLAQSLMQRVLEVSFGLRKVNSINDIFDKPNAVQMNRHPAMASEQHKHATPMGSKTTVPI